MQLQCFPVLEIQSFGDSPDLGVPLIVTRVTGGIGPAQSTPGFRGLEVERFRLRVL